MHTKNSPESATSAKQEMLCTVCGDEKTPKDVWFFVVQGHWNDTLKILGWDDNLALGRPMHRACCPAHVQELVCQWMATGDIEFLSYPGRNSAFPSLATGSSLPAVLETSTEGARQIAELAVDRESMARVLNDSPDSLLIILDELRDVLERETTKGSRPIESAVSDSPCFLKHM